VQVHRIRLACGPFLTDAKSMAGGISMIMKFVVLNLAVLVSMVVAQTSSTGQDRIVKEVRHELVMLPYYGVFDNFTYRVDGSKVTLMGQVTRPTLKSEAEKAVKRIEGVEVVDNQIEVLPLSPDDDRIRVATYHAIYSQAPLQRYQLGAVPPIHIIVKNGNITLEGVVATEGDKNIAGIAAKGVPGAFGVVNNLRVENEK
jgi:hyperosmotically inducible protein